MQASSTSFQQSSIKIKSPAKISKWLTKILKIDEIISILTRKNRLFNKISIPVQINTGFVSCCAHENCIFEINKKKELEIISNEQACCLGKLSINRGRCHWSL